jgi:hypothetical protein
VSEVQIGGRRVESGLDAQRFAALQLLDQILLQQDFFGTSANQGERIGYGRHDWTSKA